jgi:DNA primase
MARIPAAHVDDVLARTDLVALVKERVALAPAGRDFLGRCPFHEERTASFNVVPSKGFYHCFGCGAHGNAADFLMRLDHIGFRDAIAELGRRAGIQPLSDAPAAAPAPAETTGAIAAVSAAAVRFSDNFANSADAATYLASRSLTADTIAAFGVGYAADRWDALTSHLLATGHSADTIERAGLVARTKSNRLIDRFRHRIIFPIHDVGGRPIGFGGRAVGNDTLPKYLNSPDSALFRKGHHLYGLSRALKSPATRQHLIVVEGFLDVLQLAQAGYANTAATMGTAATSDQVALALRHTRRVSFCFDGDRAGRDAAYKAMLAALPQISDDHTIDFVFLPDGEDPDSLIRRNGTEAFQTALDHARPLSAYFFDSVAASLDLSTIDGRAAMVARAAPILDSMRDGPLRALMQKHLASLAGDAGDAILHLCLSDASNTLIAQLLSDGFAMTPADVIERALALALHDPQ